jgi:hypothetical protein
LNGFENRHWLAPLEGHLDYQGKYILWKLILEYHVSWLMMGWAHSKGGGYAEGGADPAFAH